MKERFTCNQHVIIKKHLLALKALVKPVLTIYYRYSIGLTYVYIELEEEPRPVSFSRVAKNGYLNETFCRISIYCIWKCWLVIKIAFIKKVHFCKNRANYSFFLVIGYGNHPLYPSLALQHLYRSKPRTLMQKHVSAYMASTYPRLPSSTAPFTSILATNPIIF